MRDEQDCGFRTNVTRSLRIHWSSPFRGRRILVGPGPTRMRPGGTRGGQATVPSQQDSQEYDGFLQPISAGGIHFVSRVTSKTGNKRQKVVVRNHCSRWKPRLYSSAK